MIEKPSFQVILMIIAAIITIVGLVTGKYFFFFLFLPLGLIRWKKSNPDEGEEDLSE